MKCIAILFLVAACVVEPATSSTEQATYIYSTGANTTIVLPAGITNATLWISHTGVTVQGAGSDATTLVADGSATTAIVFPYYPGNPIASFALRGVTIDAGSAALVGVLGATEWAGPLSLTVDDVRVIGLGPAEIAFTLGDIAVNVDDVEVQGDGRAFNLRGTSGTIDGVTIEGGTGGFIVADHTSTTTQPATEIAISGVVARADYWQGPASDVMSPTAFAAGYVDVADTNSAMRAAYDVVRVLTPIATGSIVSGAVAIAGVETFDRIETAGGAWAQVEGAGGGVAYVGAWHLPNSWIRTAAPANSTALTAYRPTLGRLNAGGWTATRLNVYRWRRVDGRAAATPSLVTGQRVEVRRARGGTGRDVDVGGVHFTAPCSGCSISDARFRGYFSDQVTLRGQDSTAERVSAELGQDMGFTIDGDGSLCSDCQATSNGYDGICVVSTATNATLISADVRHNGTQATPGTTPSPSWQVGVYLLAPTSIISAGGFGNANGVVGIGY
jgi:hypothetical protein